MNELRLDGKTAIVTGAGSGIGAAIAHLLAARGARVCVNDLREDAAETVTKEILRTGGTAIAAPGDVADSENVGEVISRAVDEFHLIHMLINNAGIGGRGKYLPEVEDAEWSQMMRVNLGSVFLMSRSALPHIPRDGSGRVVNISSMFGITGSAGSTPYAASKAGIIGFSKSLARELAAQRITVNVVAPGMVDTPMFRARGVAPAPPWLLWPRLGTPTDIAQTIAFLCSGAAEFITGQVISPNGGGCI